MLQTSGTKSKTSLFQATGIMSHPIPCRLILGKLSLIAFRHKCYQEY